MVTVVRSDPLAFKRNIYLYEAISISFETSFVTRQQKTMPRLLADYRKHRLSQVNVSKEVVLYRSGAVELLLF